MAAPRGRDPRFVQAAMALVQRQGDILPFFLSLPWCDEAVTHQVLLANRSPPRKKSTLSDWVKKLDHAELIQRKFRGSERAICVDRVEIALAGQPAAYPQNELVEEKACRWNEATSDIISAAAEYIAEGISSREG